MPKPKQQPKPKPAPATVTATKTFRHGTARVIEGSQRSSDDPIVSRFPNYFTPVARPPADDED